MKSHVPAYYRRDGPCFPPMEKKALIKALRGLKQSRSDKRTSQDFEIVDLQGNRHRAICFSPEKRIFVPGNYHACQHYHDRMGGGEGKWCGYMKFDKISEIEIPDPEGPNLWFPDLDPKSERVYLLCKRERGYLIGRDPQSDILFCNEHYSFISKTHAKVKYMNGIYFLEDSESTYGTLLNNKPVTGEAKPLKHRDVILLGEHNDPEGQSWNGVKVMYLDNSQFIH